MANPDLEALEGAEFPLDVMALSRWPSTVAGDHCGRFDWKCRAVKNCRERGAYARSGADRAIGRIACEWHVHLMKRPAA